MTEELVIDAEVVEDAPVGTAVARRERRSEVMRPLPAAELVESFKEYQALCEALLDSSDYQEFTQSEKQGEKWVKVKQRFKKKSAWRKLATAFDLDVQKVELTIERNEHGQAIRARAIYRAIAPSGRFQDGDGYCSVDEPRFEKEKSRERIENDLPATATTRAKNRAISDLLGTGEVSAEEIGGSPQEQSQSGLPHGPEVDGDLRKQTGGACVRLMMGNPEMGIELWKLIAEKCGGYMPEAAALALVAAADPQALVVDPGTPEVS